MYPILSQYVSPAPDPSNAPSIPLQVTPIHRPHTNPPQNLTAPIQQANHKDPLEPLQCRIMQLITVSSIRLGKGINLIPGTFGCNPLTASN